MNTNKNKYIFGKKGFFELEIYEYMNLIYMII